MLNRHTTSHLATLTTGPRRPARRLAAAGLSVAACLLGASTAIASTDGLPRPSVAEVSELRQLLALQYPELRAMPVPPTAPLHGTMAETRVGDDEETDPSL